MINHDLNMADYVVFSASMASESNYESTDEKGKSVGSLSYAISQVFQNLDQGCTYRTVFAKIISKMQDLVPYQNPVLEGTGLDRSVFAGNYIIQENYFEISDINGDELKISGGVFAGIDIGTRIDFYEAGTTDPAKQKKICTGVVMKVFPLHAIIKTEGLPNNVKKTELWGFSNEKVFNIEPVRLKIISQNSSAHPHQTVNNYFTAEEVKKIKAGLIDLPGVIIADENPDLILEKGEGIYDELWIASNGYGFRKLSAGNISELKTALQSFIQYRFLRNDIYNPNILFDFKLVPVVNGLPDTSLLKIIDSTGIPEFYAGDTVALWIKNKGDVPLYFNVLDLQPDGIVNCVLPSSKNKIFKDDLYIKEGESLLNFKNFRIKLSPPYGLEIFKVIISTEPLDLERAATQKGAIKRNLHPFENLINQSYEGSRGESQVLTLEDGGTISYLFKISARQSK